MTCRLLNFRKDFYPFSMNGIQYNKTDLILVWAIWILTTWSMIDRIHSCTTSIITQPFPSFILLFLLCHPHLIFQIKIHESENDKTLNICFVSFQLVYKFCMHACMVIVSISWIYELMFQTFNSLWQCLVWCCLLENFISFYAERQVITRFIQFLSPNSCVWKHLIISGTGRGLAFAFRIKASWQLIPNLQHPLHGYEICGQAQDFMDIGVNTIRWLVRTGIFLVGGKNLALCFKSWQESYLICSVEVF